MNLYQYHASPKDLNHHDKAHDKVPRLLWNKLVGELPSHYSEYEIEMNKDFMEKADIFAKDDQTAFDYARLVIGRRFKIGEPVILRELTYIIEYAIYVLNDRWPEGERELLKRGNKSQIIGYAISAIKAGDSWKEFEDYALKTQLINSLEPASNMSHYARFIKRDRIKPLEPALKKYPIAWKEYARRFGLDENS